MSSRDGSQRAEALPGSSGWFFTTNRETACAAEGLPQGESEGIGLELESSGTASSLSHLHGLWDCGAAGQVQPRPWPGSGHQWGLAFGGEMGGARGCPGKQESPPSTGRWDVACPEDSAVTPGLSGGT